MITILVVLTVLGQVAALAAGAWCPAVPSFAFVAVLLAARKGPPGRHRWIALVTGLVAGCGHQAGLMVVPMVLLVLGSLAARSRRAFVVATPAGRLLLGAVASFLGSVFVGLFLGRSAVLPEGLVGYVAFILGAFLTGATYAVAELVLDRTPSFRHALERP